MKRMTHRNISRLAFAAGLVIILIWAIQGTEFDPVRLKDGLPRLWEFVAGLFPPDWSLMLPGLHEGHFGWRWLLEDLRNRHLPSAWQALIVTLQMAIIATFLSFVAALPVSFLAARTAVIPRPFSVTVKAGLNVLRAMPAYVYAVLFVYVVGLGPFTGALGIAVGSFVFLAKLFAEALESVHPAPIEAVKAVGANSSQVFAYAMLPQALPQFLSHTLYAWELNIGAATVVGIVGAGGIGYELITQIRYYQWHKASAYILVLVAMVLLADAVSYRIRRRYT